MKEYSLEAIIWEDHTSGKRMEIPKNPDNFLTTVLSVGIVIKETDKALTLCYELERYDDRDDATFIVILKSCIVSRKIYGKIKLRKPRR